MYFGSLGAGGGRTLEGVVVGLVADIRALGIVRERNARLHEVVELPQRALALGKRDIAVAAAERGQRSREVHRGVGDGGAGAHLVVGLLV